MKILNPRSQKIWISYKFNITWKWIFQIFDIETTDMIVAIVKIKTKIYFMLCIIIYNQINNQCNLINGVWEKFYF